MIDAFRRSSAARITAVVPYYGYARQDRKDKPRVPISAKLVANLLSAAGTNRVLTMDLHKAQIQGFFDIPVDHLFAAPVIIDYCSRLNYPNLTIVSPDAGGAERARAYAKRLDGELAIVDKRRTEDGTAEVMNVIGDVRGRTCILQDDIIDTAGTIQKAAHGAQGRGRRAGAGVRGARRAVGAGDRAHREVAARSADRHQLGSAQRSGADGARRSSCCRWRGCWVRRFATSTKRRRSRRCSCRRRAQSTRKDDYGSHTRSGEADGSRARTRRGACARRAVCRPSSTARQDGEAPVGVAGVRRSEEADADPPLRLRRQHPHQAHAWMAAQTSVLVKEYQLDPVTQPLLHADFYQLAMDKALVVTVPVALKGEPRGVKLQGGLLDFVTREIEVECLPADIPEHIDVDVSELELHQSIRVRDLPPHPKWKAVSDGDTMLVHIVLPKAEESAATTAATDAAAAPTAEPEVAKKGKTDKKDETDDKDKK